MRWRFEGEFWGYVEKVVFGGGVERVAVVG